MKPLCSAVLLAAFAAVVALPTFAQEGQPQDELDARRDALELAGAFSNDGFQLRDGTWQGKLTPGQPVVLQVNLYAGNHYWFTLAATSEAKQVVLSVHDENGQPQAVEPYAEANRRAAGFAPKVSGSYYIRIEEQEGTPASFCLLYSYK